MAETNKTTESIEKVGQNITDLSKEVSDLDKVGDVVGTAADIGKQVKAKTSARAGEYGAKSLIGKAAKNIFEFPVFISSSVPMATATAVNSLLEQMYASYLQMAISINPVITEKDYRRGKIFSHLKTDTTKYLEFADTFYQKDACQNTIITENAQFDFEMVNIDKDQMMGVMEALNYEALSEFNHYFQEATNARTTRSIRDLERDVDNARDRLERAEGALIHARDLYESATDAQDRARYRAAYADARAARQDANEDLRAAERALRNQLEEERREDKAQREANEERRKEAEERRKEAEERRKERKELSEQRREGREELAELRAEADEERKEAREKREADREEREKQDFEVQKKYDFAKYRRETEKHTADMKVKAPQLMDETKIQKLNTMKPLMMTVGLKIMNKHGDVSNMIDFIVGVKTHCRMVKADILPDVVAYPTKNMNQLSKKARWRAGEIKFLDYLFSRPEKKQAAYDSKDPNRKWYHRLYTLAHSKGSSSVARKVTGKGSPEGLIPNVTIVMTKADVNMIEAETGIDLMKGSTAVRFCKELFLMSLIVVDTDAESVKVLLPDINNDYDVQSIASINKQIETLDTSNTVSREVNKLMHGR